VKKLLPFVAIWLTNSILLYVASTLYPLNFVLGNFRFSAIPAAFLSGFAWTFFTWLVKPVVSKFGFKVSGFWMKSGLYLAANFVALWVTARMAPVIGFGVSSFTYVLGLVLVAEIAQVVVWNIVAPLAKKI
jgi:hypothetical protein